MSTEALRRKRSNETEDRLTAITRSVLLHVAKVAEDEVLSLPARKEVYELVCMELLARADACTQR